MFFDTDQAKIRSGQLWQETIIPTMLKYIRIPNVSPHFDREWQEHGHMDDAAKLLGEWVSRQLIPGTGTSIDIITLKDRTPVIFIEIPGSSPGTILLYGHMDKQPGLEGWREGLDPWTPVLEGDRLYGRGSADDGYATFASVTALRLLKEQGINHARCVILIEACEESGSPDLPFYIDDLADRIGVPDLVVCLDSGCGNYEQLWMTTSLRGLVGGVLRVDILTEGVHSGHASGIVPDSFRIARSLLSRLEDEHSGVVKLRNLFVSIPPDRQEQIRKTAEALGDSMWKLFPWTAGACPYLPDGGSPETLITNETWRPALTIIGAEGLPSLEKAGNVLRPFTELKLSMRIPPGVDTATAAAAIKKTLEYAPPYGAQVRYEADQMAPGWNTPSLAPWLEAGIDRASMAFFGKPAMAQGEGGTIPFMGMLGKRFPQAQFLITGVLGPSSNAHGPNEFLHIPTAQRLTACVASVIADHAKRAQE